MVPYSKQVIEPILPKEVTDVHTVVVDSSLLQLYQERRGHRDKRYFRNASKGYERINQYAVNHKVCFEDHETWAHTNLIEDLWSSIKKSLCGQCSCVKQFDLYLAEFMRQKVSKTSSPYELNIFMDSKVKVYSQTQELC
ncbi:hypothetical protein NPIL_378631 [Nephila pilipes]|uniref:Uncharacterized protein n=1 Tax=Nephila pilipes TaxID=299642 RepID=A0A8X6PJ62_NEPPI|nr:hypothetical protein NPIL_233191 [Nephila pilipes]GFT67627.1 hypothetical protein NPIL_378631 [Nephila pilipes]